jgi:hypothetical protein
LEIVRVHEKVSVGERTIGSGGRHRYRVSRAAERNAKMDHSSVPADRRSGYSAVRACGRRDRAKLITVWKLTKSSLYLVNGKELRALIRLSLAGPTGYDGADAKSG